MRRSSVNGKRHERNPTEGGKAFIVTGDVANEDDCRRAAEEVFTRAGRLDVLVNNVVAWEDIVTPVTEMSEASLDHQLSYGFKSVFLMCKHAIPRMISSGCRWPFSYFRRA